jgi:hypothetical protein
VQAEAELEAVLDDVSGASASEDEHGHDDWNTLGLDGLEKSPFWSAPERKGTW